MMMTMMMGGGMREGREGREGRVREGGEGEGGRHVISCVLIRGL